MRRSKLNCVKHYASRDPSAFFHSYQTVTVVFAPRPLYNMMHAKTLFSCILLIYPHYSDFRSNTSFSEKFSLISLVHSMCYLHILLAPYISLLVCLYDILNILDLDIYLNIWLMLVFGMRCNILVSQGRLCFAHYCIPSVCKYLVSIK